MAKKIILEKGDLIDMHHNTWTNEFNDRITFMKCRVETGSYTISINGDYVKSVGGIKVAKAFINKFRKQKCKWTGSFE